ncbi:hypothetical protein [Flagellimonas pacifica]|uniref:Uncharacterized protein n=1 Tax=Flagellimonas pacifica TaxID=1247520 RepID=A0A285MWU4_9FLAO|nr:hypothetical protein [Allomuricauda parva]SNZ01670.1 hypothetical protein SAMN06265377_3512 [Allomuricauda parva]
MKANIFIVASLLFSLDMSAQVFNGNSCSSNLQVTFLDTARAETAFKNHRNWKEGVNLVLTENGVKYKGEYVREIDAVGDAIFQTENLPMIFEVVIGMRLDSPAENLAELLFAINEIGTSRLDSVYIYFYTL